MIQSRAVLLAVFCGLTLSVAQPVSAGSVTISSPAAGAKTGSAVPVTASASDASGIYVLQVYLDGSKVYEKKASVIDTTIAASAGDHRLVVQALTNAGSLVKSSLSFTVSSSGVTISSPADGQTVSSPVRVAASGPSGTQLMQIYLDGAKVYETRSGVVDTSIAATTGSHRLTVQALDSSLNPQKATVNVSVGSASSSATTTFSKIEELTGWDSCDHCAGKDGNGPATYHTMTHNQSSPSLDGDSTRFHIEGDGAYGAALWWKQLGGNDAAANFVYETYFYVKDPSRSQALEFDINQSVKAKGVWYIFGTECDYRDKKQWKVWDNYYSTWRTTGIACTVPKAYTWNHLVLEFARTSSGVKYLSVTLNGVKSYFNRSYAEKPNSASNSHINIAFQMDGNSTTEAYDVWLDKLKLTYW